MGIAIVGDWGWVWLNHHRSINRTFACNARPRRESEAIFSWRRMRLDRVVEFEVAVNAINNFVNSLSPAVLQQARCTALQVRPKTGGRSEQLERSGSYTRAGDDYTPQDDLSVGSC